MSSDDEHPTGEGGTGDDARQRIVRIPGSRRVRLTPVPGSIAEPVTGDEKADAAPGDDAGDAASGPNDERLRRDVPPHY